MCSISSIKKACVLLHVEKNQICHNRHWASSSFNAEGKVLWCYILLWWSVYTGLCFLSLTQDPEEGWRRFHICRRSKRERERSKPIKWMLGLHLWMFRIVFQRFIAITGLLSFFVAWRVESENVKCLVLNRHEYLKWKTVTWWIIVSYTTDWLWLWFTK